MVPLANMFGYVNKLRSFTQGRANYTMQFAHYERCPANVADEVQGEAQRPMSPEAAPDSAGAALDESYGEG